MAKSIKLKNDNYIDSTGVVHNRGLLSTLLNNINTSLTNIINRFNNDVIAVDTIFTGTCKYGNTCCSIDRTKYYKIDVYLTHGIKRGAFNSPYNNDIVVSIDCDSTSSHMAGGCFSVSGSETIGFYEIVLKDGTTDAQLYIDWCVTTTKGAITTWTTHTNDNEFYCYKVLGYRKI